MDINEFELRHRAYKGLNYKFGIDRDNDTLLQLTKITNKGTLSKKLQDLTPDELHEITIETYTQYKKDIIQKYKDTKEIGGNTLEFSITTYIERLEYEMKVIKEMGFNGYFLIVSDFVRRAKKNNIVVGPGRGSGAGSLLARLIRITDIDPLPYALLFERFLNPARISMPDFDIDFEDTQRFKVIEYVQQKYGSDKVSSIGTFMQMASKAAFKDAARTLGVPFERSNQISAIIPDKTSLADAIKMQDENEELKSAYNSDEKIKQAIDFGSKLEGNMRQLGVHACGIIISPEKVTTYTPTQYIKEDDNTLVSQYDGPTLETIGILKMDFLGLRNLSVIKNCIKIIKKKHEKENKELPDIFKEFFKNTSFQPPIDDKYTYDKVFKEGDTTGIFQFEGSGMRKFLIKLEPNSINDLVAMNALYRPGPMEFIPTYIDRKHGKEKVNYMHPELKEILEKEYGNDTVIQEGKKLEEDLKPIMNLTYGIAVYQEQLIFLVQAMAGFSLAEADMLRRGVGKKKKDVIEKIKKEFIKRCKDYKEYKKETSQFIYEKMIEPAAFYSFNKSHSVCYAMIAYQTAYLKAHYPVEFYAALIRSVEQDTDELSNYIYETQQHGINVLAPNINYSFNHVAAISNEIRLGFFCIKGLGFEIGESFQEERKKNGQFSSLEDFLKRCQPSINKKSLEGLIKSGALDNFYDRGTLLQNAEYILDRTKSSQNANQGLFGMENMVTKLEFKNTKETSMMEKLMMEQEVFKTFVSANPLDGLYSYLKKFSFISQFQNTENFGPFIITGYINEIQRAKKKGFFIKVEDISGKIEIFTKDVLDFKKFDILIISGYKGRSISIDKIIKTSRDNLVKQSGERYDPEMTVVKAKGMRFGEMKKALEEVKIEKLPELPTEDIQEEENLSFKLPDKIEKINEMITIINEYKGDIQVQIGNKEVSLNEEGLHKIKALLLIH
ncbi:MAG: DNA polymerase III subunit alpha [Candidatus Absconditicoccaceae bacterium]